MLGKTWIKSLMQQWSKSLGSHKIRKGLEIWIYGIPSPTPAPEGKVCQNLHLRSPVGPGRRLVRDKGSCLMLPSMYLHLA